MTTTAKKTRRPALSVVHTPAEGTPVVKARASRKAPAPKLHGVVAQVVAAFGLSPAAAGKVAVVLGVVLGTFVPVAAFVTAHVQLGGNLWQPTGLLVLGALVYSAKTVFAWGRMAFGEGAKALGFCVLVEGVLLVSTVPWLSYAALVILAAINAIATTARLRLQK